MLIELEKKDGKILWCQCVYTTFRPDGGRARIQRDDSEETFERVRRVKVFQAGRMIADEVADENERAIDCTESLERELSDQSHIPGRFPLL